MLKTKSITKARSRTQRKSHSVYVIELSKQVWTDSWKFRKANPQYMGMLECLYVGMTSHSPQERFKKHKTGHRNKKGHKISAYFAEKYGLYLRPTLYSQYNPLNKSEAAQMEAELAKELKEKGYAVWWN